MPLSVPLETAFYFEIWKEFENLYLWIPQGELSNMVRKEQIRRTILEDYPDGLLIEANGIEPRHYLDEYKLPWHVWGTQPWTVWRAFQIIKKNIKLPSSGYIKRSFIFNIAYEVERVLEKESLLENVAPMKRKDRIADIVLAKQAGKPQGRIFLDKKRELNEKAFDFLENIPIEDISEISIEIPFEKQWFSQLKMSKGESPESLFSRVLDIAKQGEQK